MGDGHPLQSVRLALSIAFACLAMALGGCGGALPSSGPLSREIGGTPTKTDPSNYVVIDVDNSVIREIGVAPYNGFGRLTRTAARAPRARIGAGDVLAVTIFEAGDGGLFAGKDGRQANFPTLQVDQQGYISLPYAGLLKVSNHTPHEVQKLIVDRLAGRAIQPQAVVTIAKTESNTFVLAGDVEHPGRYPLSTTGDRLLDIVAKAGGSKHPAREVYVTFVRGQQRETQLLEKVIDDQRENIFVLAGDRIYVTHDPKRYTVFGAVKKPGAYVFPASQVNVLEAMAVAGGLVDELADATGLFVFRYEPESTIRRVKPAFKGIPGIVGPVPTVYRISLRDPGSYFYARGFLLRDKDVVYVANSPSVEIGKVMRLLLMGTQAVANVSGGVRTMQVIENNW